MSEYQQVSLPVKQTKAIQVVADARFGGNFQECLEQAVQNAIVLWAKQAVRQHPEATKTRFSPDRPAVPVPADTRIGGLTNGH